MYNQYQYDDLTQKPDDVYAQAKYQIICDFLANKHNLNILNAGFGSGELSLRLLKMGHTVTNLEPVQEYIDLAKTRIPAEFLNKTSFIKTTIEEYSAVDQYDCVISTDVLEHIKDDKFALNKLTQFVRPYGLIIITIPAEPILFGFHDRSLGHYRRYTLESFLQVNASDITIDYARYFGWTLIPICLLYSKFLQREYPVQKITKNKWLQKLLKIFLWIDKKIDFNTGVTLLIFGQHKMNMSKPSIIDYELGKFLIPKKSLLQEKA